MFLTIAGRKPKPQGQARHRVKPVHDWTEVENVAFVGGPKLPRLRTNGRPWMKRTKDKWLAWSTMPHCVLWGPAEWDFALDAIELAAQFHEGVSRAATELRSREKVIGTTIDSRRDLRIRYVEPKVVEPAGENVTSLSDYRDL